MTPLGTQLNDVGLDIEQYLTKNYLVGSDRDNMLMAVSQAFLTIVDIYQDEFLERQQITVITYLIDIMDSTIGHDIGDRIRNRFFHAVSLLSHIVSRPHWEDAWMKVIVNKPKSYLSELYTGDSQVIKNYLVICA